MRHFINKRGATFQARASDYREENEGDWPFMTSKRLSRSVLTLNVREPYPRLIRLLCE